MAWFLIPVGINSLDYRGVLMDFTAPAAICSALFQPVAGARGNPAHGMATEAFAILPVLGGT
jgi:hypothetical protein